MDQQLQHQFRGGAIFQDETGSPGNERRLGIEIQAIPVRALECRIVSKKPYLKTLCHVPIRPEERDVRPEGTLVSDVKEWHYVDLANGICPEFNSDRRDRCFSLLPSNHS